MPRTIKTDWLKLLKDTYSGGSQHKISRMAAALTYYALFSLAPLLIIAIAIIGVFFGAQSARAHLQQQMQAQIGQEGANALEKLIDGIQRSHSGGLASAIGAVLLLYGAFNLLAELQDSLNTLWDVRLKPDAGWKAFLWQRLFSFLMILGVALILLASLVVTTALSALPHIGGYGTLLFQFLNLAVSIGVLTLLFGLTFKVLPDVHLRWKDIWMGALFTATLFTIAKWLLGLYLARPAVTSPYGAAGSVVALLMFFFYSAEIFFYGAEFTQAYVRRHGDSVAPCQYAECISGASYAGRQPHTPAAPSAGAILPSRRQMREVWPLSVPRSCEAAPVPLPASRVFPLRPLSAPVGPSRSPRTWRGKGPTAI